MQLQAMSKLLLLYDTWSSDYRKYQIIWALCKISSYDKWKYGAKD